MIKFISGAVAGWIATTDEGKQFANKIIKGGYNLSKQMLIKQGILIDNKKDEEQELQSK